MADLRHCHCGASYQRDEYAIPEDETGTQRPECPQCATSRWRYISDFEAVPTPDHHRFHGCSYGH